MLLYMFYFKAETFKNISLANLKMRPAEMRGLGISLQKFRGWLLTFVSSSWQPWQAAACCCLAVACGTCYTSWLNEIITKELFLHNHNISSSGSAIHNMRGNHKISFALLRGRKRSPIRSLDHFSDPFYQKIKMIRSVHFSTLFQNGSDYM